ncbi:hypothetical protein CSB11_00195 [Candidatus Campbellbacteria bacterium]|nr:MAG: hypothetical protein CSB11_00195 [Candidatus Campbellbacteria bacterium]
MTNEEIKEFIQEKSEVIDLMSKTLIRVIKKDLLTSIPENEQMEKMFKHILYDLKHECLASFLTGEKDIDEINSEFYSVVYSYVISDFGHIHLSEKELLITKISFEKTLEYFKNNPK